MFDKLKTNLGIGDNEDKKQAQEEQKSLQDNQQKKDLFTQMKVITTEKIKTFVDDVEKKAEDVQNSAVQKLDNIKSEMNKGILQYKVQINTWIAKKVEDTVINTLEKARPVVKTKLKDEDMCQCVKNWVDDMVDSAWPNIVEETKFQLQMNTQEPYVEIPKNDHFFLFLPWYFLRSKYLYSSDPYDQSIWKRFKSFWWWFFTLIAAFPFFGVQPCFYLFIFLCIDKSDEYQLVKFILSFKKMQFITQGAINGTIGYLMYFSCLNMNKNGKNLDSCPGNQLNFYYDVIVFILQIILIWLAWLQLPCSKQKGRPKLRYAKNNNQLIEEEMEHGCICNLSRGGALQCVMIIDFFCFGIAIALFFITTGYMNIDFSKRIEDARPFLFFTKIVYGLLSFPFLMFAIGPIANLLTKSKPTAYDKHGNCIPKRKTIKIMYDEENALKQQLDIDIEDMFKDNK